MSRPLMPLMAMAAGARALGAEIYRRTRVMDIRRIDTGEWLVTTDQGELVCEHVVNAGGSYCNEIASWTGHRAPIANMLHHYLITEPVAQLIAHKPELPVVRDPWAHAYFPRGGRRHPCRTCTRPPARTNVGMAIHPPGISKASWSRRSSTASCHIWKGPARRFPLFAKSGIKPVISGAITAHSGRRTAVWPGTRRPQLLDALRSVAGHLPGSRRRPIPGAMDGAWPAGHQRARIRSAPLRRLGDARTYTRAVGIADYQHMYYCYKPAEQHDVGRDLRPPRYMTR